MKKLILLVLPIVLVVVGAAYFALPKSSGPEIATTTPISILPDPKATTTPVAGGSATAGYHGQAMTYLGSPVVLAKIPAGIVDAGKKRLEAAIALIGKYPKDPDNWIELGLAKKLFENYIGARDAWEYAKMLDPNKPLAYYNLGNLYGAYLKDNAKAELNYAKTIQLDPYVDYPYLGLAEFYENFYKEKSAMAESTLLAGLKVMPSQPSIILALAIYYRDHKQSEKAITYFELYLKAEANLDSMHRQLIQQEIDKLKFN